MLLMILPFLFREGGLYSQAKERGLPLLTEKPAARLQVTFAGRDAALDLFNLRFRATLVWRTDDRL